MRSICPQGGRGGGHRTHDLRIKSPLLLPAELHPGCVWCWCRCDPAGTRSESVETESTCAAATRRNPCPRYSTPSTRRLFRSATGFRVVWLGNQQFSRLLHPFRSRALVRMEPASVRMCLRSAPRQSAELLVENGGTQTRDPLLARQVLYSTELRPRRPDAYPPAAAERLRQVVKLAPQVGLEPTRSGLTVRRSTIDELLGN